MILKLAIPTQTQTMNQTDSFEQVRTRFFWRKGLTLPDGREVILALLLRQEDWRPLDAPWWRGKQASIIAVDIHGNFFLRHSNGSVQYWDHRAQANTMVAPSVRAFAALIIEAGIGRGLSD